MTIARSASPRSAESLPLLGSAPEALARAKSPRTFAELCAEAALAHPEIRFTSPETPTDWLVKRGGGSGGLHIAEGTEGRSLGAGDYWQRRKDGRAISLLFTRDSRELTPIAWSEQWTCPCADAPFRFGGAAGPLDLAPPDRLLSRLAALTESLGVRGLASADFLDDGETWWLLEINPRPGATLDVFDDAEDPLLTRHLDALAGRAAPPPKSRRPKAAEIVYASIDGVAPSVDWPDWAADRPREGAPIRAGAPFCTVSARGATVAEAKAIVKERSRRNPVLASGGRHMSSASQISVNGGAAPWVDLLRAEAARLEVGVETGKLGETLIDAGAKRRGGVEAGLIVAKICLGGLGDVTLTSDGSIPRWPWTICVRSSQPVLACLGSQYAGWSLSHGEGRGAFFALGSGPARSLAQKEALFEEIGYRDAASRTTLVIESGRPPPAEVVEKVAAECGLPPSALTIIFAPTQSLTGGVQVVARVLEVALHKAHALKFPLARIVDGFGAAPLSPPHPDFMTAMGRTNDAIIYGGRVHLFVTGPADEARALAEALPSRASRDYGAPFRDIFKRFNGDFYAIDPMLFSPAQTLVTAVATGATFRAGAVDEALLDASLG